MIKQENIGQKNADYTQGKTKRTAGKQVADKQIEGILNCTLFEWSENIRVVEMVK